MISQAIIRNEDRILMVRQYVQRGDIVWNFPGGGIEVGESPEEACIREVREETGFTVAITRLLLIKNDKYSYECEITGGKMQLDKTIIENEDILEVDWIQINDESKFDSYTVPFIELLRKETN